VFDESVLAWTGGTARTTRDFLRNVALATAAFDYVMVVCNALISQVEATVADMTECSRSRVLTLTGSLEAT
jgi:hypothetical protein